MLYSSTFRIWIVLAFFVVRPSIAADDEVAIPSQKDSFHLYLLIGQSNMAGRGKIVAKDNNPPARILKLDKQNRWMPATDPLHYDKPAIAGVGPGSGFGPAMAVADKTITIGLIPSAFGGTPLKRWEKKGDLYQNAIKRAKAAMAHGTLKGVIWHQGESDSKSPETAGSYGIRLRKMISDLRNDLKSPDLPFVVGKLGEFITAERLPHAQTVNDALGMIPEQVEMTACVETTGLKAKSDGIHFGAEAARELGRRYASAMLKLQQKSNGQTDNDQDATHSKLDD